MLRRVVLGLLASWLSLVAYTDFVVVPTVFTTLTSRIEAGELGMKVFSALGFFETICSIVLFFCGIVIFKKFRTKRAAYLFVFATVLCGSALLGKFYMTPKITELNTLKYTLSESSPEYVEADRDHQFYHDLYVKLDGAKMLLLIAGIFGSFRSSRFDNETLFAIRKTGAISVDKRGQS